MTSRRDLLLALFFLYSSLAYQPVLAREDRWDNDDDDDDDDDDRRRRNRPSRRRDRDD